MFAACYSQLEFGSQSVTQLPWGHIQLLLFKVKDEKSGRGMLCNVWKMVDHALLWKSTSRTTYILHKDVKPIKQQIT